MIFFIQKYHIEVVMDPLEVLHLYLEYLFGNITSLYILFMVALLTKLHILWSFQMQPRFWSACGY